MVYAEGLRILLAGNGTILSLAKERRPGSSVWVDMLLLITFLMRSSFSAWAKL